MHILVCGGAGYIGSHMSKLLAQAGHRVTLFDNLSTGHAQAARYGELVRGDVLIEADLERAFAGRSYTAVMHFCAKSLVGESIVRPDLYYLNNVTGTLNLLQAMVRHDVRSLVFSSSAAVYGAPVYLPINEEHPKAPINPYGQSKLMVENLLSDYRAAFNLRSVCLRYFNAAGADPSGEIGEDHTPETHLIPNVLKSLLNDSVHPLKIFGNDYDTRDGTCIRDYVHVMDLCDAHLKALDYLARDAENEVFNLGTETGFSVLEVIEAVQQVTGKKVAYSVQGRRPGDPPVLVASAKKALSLLAWSPQYRELAQIVETAWRWHNRH